MTPSYPPRRRPIGTPLLIVVRYVVPGAFVVAGAILAAVASGETAQAAGVAAVSIGLILAVVNTLLRLGLESNHDRADEEEARRYYDRHGRWPPEG